MTSIPPPRCPDTGTEPFADIVTAIGAQILRRLADSWMAEAAELRLRGGKRKKRYEWHAIIAEQHARELAAVIGLPYAQRAEDITASTGESKD